MRSFGIRWKADDEVITSSTQFFEIEDSLLLYFNTESLLFEFSAN